MSEKFDPEHAVATYRQVIGKRDEQTADPDWIEFNSIVQRLRREWKECVQVDFHHSQWQTGSAISADH